MKTGIIVACVFVLGISYVFADQRSWGVGGCAVAQAATHEWKADDQEAALYRNGVQIGSWSYAEGYWRSYDARRDVWGPKEAKAPVEPPPRTGVVPKEEPLDVTEDLTHQLNMGMDWSKIADHQASYGGRVISCDKAHELIGKQIPDDSKKFRLTVIGTLPEQKEALVQFAILEPDIKDRCIPWVVAADHWSLKDTATGQVAFKTEGKPVVYLQDPDGKVLHRQDDAKDMPQAIRKAIKAYDAAKDPDMRKPSPISPAAPIHPAIPVTVVLGGAALFAYMKGK